MSNSVHSLAFAIIGTRGHPPQLLDKSCSYAQLMQYCSTLMQELKGELPRDWASVDAFNDKMAAIYNGTSLDECPHCGRTFCDDAFRNHRKVRVHLAQSDSVCTQPCGLVLSWQVRAAHGKHNLHTRGDLLT